MEQRFELDREAFEHWLKGLPLSNIAGHGEDPESCPIANFLAHVFDEPFAWVSRETFGIGMYQKEPTPPWAQKFLRHIQNHCGRNGEVYVDDCIEVLRSIKPSFYREH
tara:strand:- start:6125 stop:6448 length:324 start_codon:yes stop_codon:yes gene_type:complete